MNIPEIYKEVDMRKYSLTDRDVLCKHLLVLVLSSAFSSPGSAVCQRNSRAFFIESHSKKLLN